MEGLKPRKSKAKPNQTEVSLCGGLGDPETASSTLSCAHRGKGGAQCLCHTARLCAAQDPDSKVPSAPPGSSPLTSYLWYRVPNIKTPQGEARNKRSAGGLVGLLEGRCPSAGGAQRQPTLLPFLPHLPCHPPSNPHRNRDSIARSGAFLLS